MIRVIRKGMTFIGIEEVVVFYFFCSYCFYGYINSFIYMEQNRELNKELYIKRNLVYERDYLSRRGRYQVISINLGDE